MRRLLIAAMAAATLLAPLADAVAQGRGNGRGPERRAEREFRREAPRPAQEGRRAYRAPPRALDRGQVLPPPYRGERIEDFDRHRLRPPPAGYNWVQVGRDIYLTQRSTGLVVEAIPGGY